MCFDRFVLTECEFVGEISNLQRSLVVTGVVVPNTTPTAFGQPS